MDPESGHKHAHKKKVQVLYYLSPGGGAQMDHPHLIEGYLPPPSSQVALPLKEVKKWMMDLRGPDMPNAYAWSYRRAYEGGYVWHDLSENDVIYPIYKLQYVLMGSEIHHYFQGKCNCGKSYDRVGLDKKSDDYSNLDLQVHQAKSLVYKQTSRELSLGNMEANNHVINENWRAYKVIPPLAKGADAATQTEQEPRFTQAMPPSLETNYCEEQQLMILSCPSSSNINSNRRRRSHNLSDLLNYELDHPSSKFTSSYKTIITANTNNALSNCSYGNSRINLASQSMRQRFSCCSTDVKEDVSMAFSCKSAQNGILMCDKFSGALVADSPTSSHLTRIQSNSTLPSIAIILQEGALPSEKLRGGKIMNIQKAPLLLTQI